MNVFYLAVLYRLRVSNACARQHNITPHGLPSSAYDRFVFFVLNTQRKHGLVFFRDNNSPGLGRACVAAAAPSLSSSSSSSAVSQAEGGGDIHATSASIGTSSTSSSSSTSSTSSATLAVSFGGLTLRSVKVSPRYLQYLRNLELIGTYFPYADIYEARVALCASVYMYKCASGCMSECMRGCMSECMRGCMSGCMSE